jgi:hypothetical protein
MVRITRRKSMRIKHKTRHYRKLRQRKRQSKRHTRRRRKQRGGSTNFFSIDNRYRPTGSISDSIKYHTKNLMNSIQGNYKAINPSVSNQPIGKPLSAKNLKFGVGTTANSQTLFNEATLRSSAFPNTRKLK